MINQKLSTQWRLEDIYKNDDELDCELKELHVKAKNFATMFKGKLKELGTRDFLEAVRAYELILELVGKVMTYAYLKFALDSNKGAFLARYQEECVKLQESLLFFELEFNRLSKVKQEQFIECSNGYAYYLKSLQATKPHQLSIKEERVLLKKSSTSSSAFSRLFDEHFSRMSFEYDGEKLSEEEILSKLYSPSREVRKKASDVLTQELQKHQHLLGYIFNMIKQDHKSDCELRGYKNPEIFRHIDNKISQKSVDALVSSTCKEFGLVHKYYEKKREILGLSELYDYDRYAPLVQSEDEYSYERSCEIVLKAFEKFSPKFAKIAKIAMSEGWIDVYPNDGKRSGAFSHPSVKFNHPYVLLNHTNRRRDLFTLAHELGHAIHQQLSYSVGYLNSDTPLTTAETASVFAEMLVFDYIKDELDENQKQVLLAGKLEDIFATLFRQINFTTFERAVHGIKDELSLDEIGRAHV